MLEWISSPIALYAMTGGGLLGSLGLWITARIEIAAVRNKFSHSCGTVDNRVQELSRSLNQLRTERELEAVPVAPVLSKSLNLTKRSQIVRMYRRGETEASIAAALQAPRNEVELVVKLDKLLVPARPSGGLESED